MPDMKSDAFHCFKTSWLLGITGTGPTEVLTDCFSLSLSIPYIISFSEAYVFFFFLVLVALILSCGMQNLVS